MTKRGLPPTSTPVHINRTVSETLAVPSLLGTTQSRFPAARGGHSGRLIREIATAARGGRPQGSGTRTPPRGRRRRLREPMLLPGQRDASRLLHQVPEAFPGETELLSHRALGDAQRTRR